MFIVVLVQLYTCIHSIWMIIESGRECVCACVMSVYEWPFCLTVLAKFSVMLIFNYIWLIWVAITHNLWIMLMKFTYNSTQYNTHTHILLLSHLHPPTDSLSNAYMRNAHHISTIAISFFTRTFHIHTHIYIPELHLIDLSVRPFVPNVCTCVSVCVCASMCVCELQVYAWLNIPHVNEHIMFMIDKN